MRSFIAKVLRSFVDYLFGFDFFISYSQRYGTAYPLAIAEALSKAGFNVFLDRNVYVAGDELSSATVRRARMSTKLVLILRPHTLDSIWVNEELAAAIACGRDIIVIDINDTWKSVSDRLAIFASLNQRLRVPEHINQLDGVPSDRAIAELTKSFNETRKQVFRQRVMALIAMLMTILTLVAGVLWWDSAKTAADAVEQRNSAVINQSQLLDQLSRGLTIEGNAGDGALLALEALATVQKQKISPANLIQAESALYFALQNLRELKVIPHGSSVAKIRLGKQKDLAFTLAGGVVRLWRTTDWQDLGIVSETTSVSDAAFSPDESMLVTAGRDGAVKIWSTATPGVPLRTCKTKDIETSDTYDEIDIDPSGSFILQYLYNQTVTYVWSINDCDQLLKKTGQTFDRTFSRDGRNIAIGLSQGVVQILDSRSGTTLKTLTHSKPKDREDFDVLIRRTVFSPDGHLLATADNVGTINVWRCENWTLLYTLHHPDWEITDIAFDPNSNRLASADYRGNVFIWNLENGTKSFSFQQGGMPANLIFDVPRNDLIVSTGTHWYFGTRIAQPKYPIKIWSLVDGTQVATLSGHTGGINSVQITQDGSSLITASDDETVRIWSLDVDTDRLKLGERKDVTNVDIAKSSDVFVTVSGDDGVVKVGQNTSGNVGHTLVLGETPYGVSLDPEGRRLVVLHSDFADVWELETAKKIDSFAAVESPRRCSGSCRKLLSEAYDGHQYAIGGWGKIWLKNLDDANSPAKLLPLPDWLSDRPIDVLRFTPKGNTLIAIYSDIAAVAVEDVAKLSNRTAFISNKNAVSVSDVSADGNFVAVREDPDGPTKVWDLNLGEEDARLPKLGGAYMWSLTRDYTIAFSPDAKKIAVSNPGEVDIWDLFTGKVVQKLDHRSGPVAIPAISFSADGKRIISGSQADNFSTHGHVHLWDVETGVELVRFTAANQTVRFVGFSASGDRVFAWSVGSTGLFHPSGTFEYFKIYRDKDALENFARGVLPRKSKSN